MGTQEQFTQIQLTGWMSHQETNRKIPCENHSEISCREQGKSGLASCHNGPNIPLTVAWLDGW